MYTVYSVYDANGFIKFHAISKCKRQKKTVTSGSVSSLNDDVGEIVSQFV